MAELADALDLGSSGNTRAGSTPVIRTRKFLLQPLPKNLLSGWVLRIGSP